MWTLPVDRLGRLEWWRLKDAKPKIKGSVYEFQFGLQYYVDETKDLQRCLVDEAYGRVGYGAKQITIIDIVYRYEDGGGSVHSVAVPAEDVERVLPELKLLRVPTDNGLSELTEKMKQLTAEMKKQHEQTTKSLAELRDLVIELMAKVSWKEDLSKETAL